MILFQYVSLHSTCTRIMMSFHMESISAYVYNFHLVFGIHSPTKSHLFFAREKSITMLKAPPNNQN